ncbi:hypothetical protein AAFF_G00292630 [Aldrovandia affinis]|uniref:Uncharacterized protein n=1 Tax=Aldrovandia affinis TaxID=143900 RepID=A0AAD7SRR5_9TELE|nr:hypothetical protein AAFF_G00292630 [Aldrovandia affinis]
MAGQTESEDDPGEVELPERQADEAAEGPTDSHHQGNTLCAELQRDVPICVPLPIEILSPETTFPFLDATLAALGIAPSSVKERVVLADLRRTTVKGNVGKKKDKEIMILEVRVTAQHPDDPEIQEVVYITETHSDRSFGRCSLAILPWKHTDPGRKLQMTLALDLESQPELQGTEEKQEG